MADPIEKHDTPLKGLDHGAEALALLGNYRPPAGTAEAIAAAQVHATLALAEAQADVVRMLSMATRELNAGNMFKLADSLPEAHTLRGVIHNGLLGHLTKSGALHTDVMLAVRIKDLGLEVKAGDDLVVGNPDGTKSINLLVIDPDNDEWLLLSDDESVLDKTVDSPRIHELFECEIRSMTVTLKDSPTI
ncbi:hypothetical protein BJQ89_00202 [Arthrobacter sp. ES1]|nr:hypothetical protein [Arthrobacter sp. ES1]